MSIERLLASGYAQQVQLLVQSLPLVFQQDCFALKGGTACQPLRAGFATAFRRHRSGLSPA